MNKHINTLGLLHLVLGGMGVIALVSISLLVFLGAGFASMEDPTAGFILGTIGIIFMLIMIVAALPDLLIGYGLVKRKSWARIFTIVLSVINLFAFPFGTAIGVYGLWVMFQPGVEEAFGERAARPVQPQPVVPPGTV